VTVENAAELLAVPRRRVCDKAAELEPYLAFDGTPAGRYGSWRRRWNSPSGPGGGRAGGRRARPLAAAQRRVGAGPAGLGDPPGPAGRRAAPRNAGRVDSAQEHPRPLQRPAGCVGVEAGRGQLGPNGAGELGRGEGEQVGQGLIRVAVAGGEPERVDHLPGGAERSPDGGVAQLAGLFLVGLGGAVELGIRRGGEQERMDQLDSAALRGPRAWRASRRSRSAALRRPG
jgi:hypothetical protein